MPVGLSNGVREVDTVIVGNGPSALILSFILAGNTPYYAGGHHDAVLHQKLGDHPNLLQATPEVYDHLDSSLRYSSQALPVNTLLDTLLRPAGDTDINPKSCIRWRREPEHAVSHLVIGNSKRPGGQWAENPVEASWDIGSLSYGDQLSLPGYSLADHWLATQSAPLPEHHRPSRTEVADYFAAYPAAVGIAASIRTGEHAAGITRTVSGFHIASHAIHCRHLVLASGTFSNSLPPPHFLAPLTQISSPTDPLLVIGSGFTAADIIISTPPTRKILHMFIWDPEHRPSPLRGCHPQAYPEYAGVYKQMKQAAARAANYGRRASLFNQDAPAKKSRLRHSAAGSSPAFEQRDWAATYEGFPNATIMSVSTAAGTFHDPARGSATSLFAHGHGHGHGLFHRRRSSLAPPEPDPTTTTAPPAPIEHATIEIASPTPQDTLVRDTRTVGALRYAAGRRGSLGYLSPPLLREVLSAAPSAAAADPAARRGSVDHDFALDGAAGAQISGETLRAKLEAGPCVAAGVFAVGSLTGDSLVRFAYGCCCVVGGAIRADAARGAGMEGLTGGMARLGS